MSPPCPSEFLPGEGWVSEPFYSCKSKRDLVPGSVSSAPPKRYLVPGRAWSHATEVGLDPPWLVVDCSGVGPRWVATGATCPARTACPRPTCCNCQPRAAPATGRCMRSHALHSTHAAPARLRPQVAWIIFVRRLRSVQLPARPVRANGCGRCASAHRACLPATRLRAMPPDPIARAHISPIQWPHACPLRSFAVHLGAECRFCARASALPVGSPARPGASQSL